jgi:hypothetical protein
MAATTFTIELDELLGLSALAELDGAPDGGVVGAVGEAKVLMRTALADKLVEAGLPWAPSAEAVKKRAAEAAKPVSTIRRLMGHQKVRKCAACIVAVAVLVGLWGGYVQRWNWTGFQQNGQLWDWLQVLLLPVTLGTIPLWIQGKEFIGRGRRAAFGVTILAWTALVTAGYLVPLNWTGFRGVTLWQWLVLLVVPAAVATTTALTSMHVRGSKFRLRLHHKAIVAALAAGWVVTVIGGYVLQWKWTGYAGNTLWDWLGMLLPLMFPIVVLPTLLKWVSGNSAGRASEAHQAAIARIATAAGGTSPQRHIAALDAAKVPAGR